MSDINWLERVEQELSRRRLPRHEVARLIAELRDHLIDRAESYGAAQGAPGGPQLLSSSSSSTEKNMSMDASVIENLGSPEQIAEVAVREYRQRKHLLSRSLLAAFCTFVVMPLPALCLLWALVILALVQFGELVDVDPDLGDYEVTPGVVLASHVASLLLLLVPAIGLAAFYGRIARRTGRSWLWGLPACLLVAVGAGLVNYTLTFADPPGKNMMMFGIGWPVPRLQIEQFLLPLSIGSLVLLRSARITSCDRMKDSPISANT
jgi:hypothetical protein